MNLSKIQNVLIIAPHPDDEVLGCGGVITKLVKLGKTVFVTILTNGHKSDPHLFPLEGTKRGRDEALEAHKVLGIEDTFFYDFPTVQLTSYPEYKISSKLSELIKEKRVDTLFIPHRGDLNSDHGVIYTASLVAARPIDENPVKRIYVYETLSETEWAPSLSSETFIPNLFIEINEELDNKIAAFNCFSPPRTRDFPHPRSVQGIKNLAGLRGQTISKNYAEAFMVVREII